MKNITQTTIVTEDWWFGLALVEEMPHDVPDGDVSEQRVAVTYSLSEGEPFQFVAYDRTQDEPVALLEYSPEGRLCRVTVRADVQIVRGGL